MVDHERYATCPLANICAQTSPGAEACGVLPEQLCPEAVQGAIKVEKQYAPHPGFPNEAAEKDLRLGCLYIEQALLSGTSLDAADAYLDEGYFYLDRAQHRDGAKPKNKVDAGLLVADLPLFEARKQGLEVSKDTLLEVRHDIASMDGHIAAISRMEEKFGNLVKIAIHLLILRDDEISYVPTFRELCYTHGRNNLSEAHRLLAHNAYLIEGGAKLPLHVNHSSKNLRHKEQLAPIGLGNTIRHGVQSVAPELEDQYPDMRSLSELVVGWLVAEAKGEILNPDEVEILDMVSESVFQLVANTFPAPANT